MQNLSGSEEFRADTQTPTLARGQTTSVLAIGLVLRLLVLWTVIAKYPSSWLYTRGTEMGLLAASMVSGHGLSSPFGGFTGPTAFIAPGYPLLIAGIFRVFGTYSTASAIAIILLQIAANLLTVWLMMCIARRLFDQRAATIAGLVWACSLPLIWMPTIFWDTSFAICMLVGLLALVLRFRHAQPGAATWVFLGAYGALLALLNPAMLLSLLAIVGWLAYETRGSRKLYPLFAVLTFALIFAPWPIRNARVFHAFIPLRTTVGFELWMGNHENSSGFLEENLFPMYNKAELAEYNRVGEIAYTKQKSQLAYSYMRSHPGTFAVLTLKRIFRFWTGTGTQAGSALFAVHAIATSALGFAGLILLYKRGRRNLVLLFALPLVLFPLPYYITHAEFRYRLAVDPLLTILAAYAVTALLIQDSNHQTPPEANVHDETGNVSLG